MTTLADLNTATDALAAAIANFGTVIGGGSGINGVAKLLTFATFADIVMPTVKAFVQVEADETNAGQSTLYFFDGTALQWLPSVEA